MIINIGGDLLPTDNNMNLFESGDVEKLFTREVVDIFGRSSLNIVNLEGPLTDFDAGIEKIGPCIKGTSKSIKAIKALGIHCASMANNHIMDYGQDGLINTIDLLKAEGMLSVGAELMLPKQKSR